MSHIYVTSSKHKIGIEGGRITIKQEEELVRSIPKETVESITVMGRSSISTACIQFLLEHGIPVNYFSGKGTYFGKLHSVSSGKQKIIKQQIILFEDPEYSINMARKIASAKIRNQEVVLRRYVKDLTPELDYKIKVMKRFRQKTETAEEIEQLMGYEGVAARTYFEALGEIVEDDFNFKGRNRRPPTDPFNSMLSFGYTLLMYEIYATIEDEGMIPFYSMMHKDYKDNPALASDLMEEWRSVIVDSLVLSMVQGHEISVDDFIKTEDGVFMEKPALNKFIAKFERKMNSPCAYLLYDNRKRTMREALREQCQRIRKSIIENNHCEYLPVIIR